MDAETYTLAPSIIADRARKLAASGLHQQALDLLQRNCVLAEIHATHVEMRLSTEMNDKRAAQDKFIGGWRTGTKRRGRQRR